MKLHSTELQQRLGFIDRTIVHAMRACNSDSRAPIELREDLYHLGLRANQARQALHARDTHQVRQSVDDLARMSDRAQNRIRPSDDVDYAVKSAVILAHIELSALRHQLD